MQGVVEDLLDLTRDRSRPAVADRDVVDLAHRRQLGRGPGEEHLIGQSQLRSRDVALDQLVAEVARDLHARPAVDAVEDRGGLRWGDDPPVLDHEHVLAGALADVALVVEQNPLLVARLERLDLRQHGVEVLPRGLRVGNQRVGGDAPVGRHPSAHALALALLAEVGAPLPHRDHGLDGVVERVEAHRPVAPPDERPDVAALERVAGDQLVRDLAQLLLLEGQLHVVELGRRLEAVQVILVAEDRRTALGLIGPDALEDARPVMHRVREYVYLRVLPGDELSVQPDEVSGVHVLLLEIGEYRPGGGLCRGVASQVRGPEAIPECAIDGRF